MIIVKENKDTISISGHANFKEYGKDIVCASVSSIIYTTVNGIFNIDRDAIKFTDNEKLLEIKVINRSKVVDILINSMLDLLNELQSQYPKNIKIVKGE